MITLAKCSRCNAPIDQLEQEQDVYIELIRWLNLVTCIKWYFPWQDVRRPDTNESLIRDEQYGIVLLGQESLFGAEGGRSAGYHEYANGYCLAFQEETKVDVTLEVYRQSGAPDGATSPAQADETFASARDVLNDVRRCIYSDELAKHRGGEGYSPLLLKINGGFETLEPSWQITTTRAEWRCSMKANFRFCRRTSYPVDIPVKPCVHICGQSELLCETTDRCEN